MHARAHRHQYGTGAEMSLKRLLWRDGEGWQERERESATEYFRLVEGEGSVLLQFVQATTDE